MIVYKPTLGQAWPQENSVAAMCVQDVDVQSSMQFTLIHTVGCALHRHTSRVIHRSKLYRISDIQSPRWGRIRFIVQPGIRHLRATAHAVQYKTRCMQFSSLNRQAHPNYFNSVKREKLQLKPGRRPSRGYEPLIESSTTISSSTSRHPQSGQVTRLRAPHKAPGE